MSIRAEGLAASRHDSIVKTTAVAAGDAMKTCFEALEVEIDNVGRLLIVNRPEIEDPVALQDQTFFAATCHRRWSLPQKSDLILTRLQPGVAQAGIGNRFNGFSGEITTNR